MNWVRRKIYLYNVTFGLYMLDWWERCFFNTLVVVLMWFVLHNGFRYLSGFYKSPVDGSAERIIDSPQSNRIQGIILCIIGCIFLLFTFQAYVVKLQELLRSLPVAGN